MNNPSPLRTGVAPPLYKLMEQLRIVSSTQSQRLHRSHLDFIRVFVVMTEPESSGNVQNVRSAHRDASGIKNVLLVEEIILTLGATSKLIPFLEQRWNRKGIRVASLLKKRTSKQRSSLPTLGLRCPIRCSKPGLDYNEMYRDFKLR
jgi:hypoxanthine-guanine phosphoribosyltransferase